MNYIPIALLAYLLNAVSVIISKLLLSNKIPHPISYVFYISAYSLVVLLAYPWIHSFDTTTLVLACLSTLLWTAGIYFLFSALKIGLADRVTPIIGTLTPLFLLVYYFLIQRSISLNQTWGALLATLGLVFLVLPFLKQTAPGTQDRTKEINLEIISGLFFAGSYIFLREVYNRTDFLTGLVISKLILVPIILFILALPSLRKLIFAKRDDQIHLFSKTGGLFLAGQISGGVSQFLITFSISLANPALVNSLQGVQYIFLFGASVVLGRYYSEFKEIVRGGFKLRILGICLIAAGLYILSFANSSPKSSTLGVTYSPRYAQSLGLDPKLTYISMLDDLSPKTIRLPIYWDLIEPKRGIFDFSSVDYYVKQAEQRGIKLTLVIGLKVPRYPECYFPAWVNQKDSQSLNYYLENELTAIVNHYKNSKALDIWQVENEPLFPFGRCPSADFSRLTREIATVRKTDPNHQIMVTESGEYGLWITSSQIADIVGSTLYRRTLAPYLPWFKSPLPPFFYQLKGMVIHLFYPNKRIFVSELQAEPWANGSLNQSSYQYQSTAFPLSDLKQNVDFAKEAGFDTIYLWGVEWWYYLAKTNHPEYLNQAILIFKGIV